MISMETVPVQPERGTGAGQTGGPGMEALTASIPVSNR